ncbi:type II/IV secretion system protein [Vitiosangium sp. GDMCC 1.1324]|nr:type II/IV secretion system protein [Vitiosangium sp. GDMCC 1.1324]
MAQGPESFSELAQYSLDRNSIRRLPEPFCRRNMVVVLGKVDAKAPDAPVSIGMLHPEDSSLRLEIADYLQRPIQAVKLNRYEIDKALEAGFGVGAQTKADLVIRKRPHSHREPTPVELVDDLLAGALERKASDIHIESYLEDVDLRYRIDGILHQSHTDMDPESVQEVVSRLKVLAGLDITERRRPQDGRIRAVIARGEEQKVLDFRVSVTPSPGGEDVVIRVLDSSVGLVPVSKLGMNPAMERLFLQLLSNPEGLILVTGPTGSGKTTTLYGALAQLNDGRKKIITAEDPIEYYVPKVNQKEVTPQLSHAALLRALLRQDPNVMLVGEIRDLETGSMALNAAATGHVVLGTLHTADSVGAVGRLRGLELESTDIADSLLAVLAQRLVRRNCEKCMAPTEPTPEQRELLGPLLDGIQFQAGRGCEECRHTGYRGRIGIYELLVVDSAMQDLIASGAHGVQLRRHAREHGFRTLVEDALDKIAAGHTTLAELLRVVPYRQLIGTREDRQQRRGREG